MNDSFTLFHVPKVDFGVNSLTHLTSYLDEYKNRGDLLFITSNTMAQNATLQGIIKELEDDGAQIHLIEVHGEPTVDSIDAIVTKQYELRVSCVLGIGGGSVLDSAKAVSVMLFHQHKWKDPHLSIKIFLEGVGTKKAPSFRLPLVLVPTTSGTGSEATKNGVVSQVGEDGFKKSFRDDSYIPDIAIIDPILTLTVPKDVTSSTGLDTLTQLMEGYVSDKNNFYIDSIALPAIHKAGEALSYLLDNHLDDIDARSSMSYASYISGVTLAHKGLTYVHGLSGPMGSLRHIPHGVACAILIGPINRAMVEEAQKDTSIALHTEFLKKMSLIAKGWDKEKPIEAVEYIESIVEKAALKSLTAYGFTQLDMKSLSTLSSKRNSPVTLSESILYDILISLL